MSALNYTIASKFKMSSFNPATNTSCTQGHYKYTDPATSSNFKRGSYISLANGSLRKVEDMRTEDFITSADSSNDHQLKEATVVKITTKLNDIVVITFSYDRNLSKVDIEVCQAHPFFVYGQGWASCNPEVSLLCFDLKCQRLQVGDICICLVRRQQVPLIDNDEALQANVFSREIDLKYVNNEIENYPKQLQEETTHIISHDMSMNNNLMDTNVYSMAAFQYHAAVAAAAAQNVTMNMLSAHNRYASDSINNNLLSNYYANNIYQSYAALYTNNNDEQPQRAMDVSINTNTQIPFTSPRNNAHYYRPENECTSALDMKINLKHIAEHRSREQKQQNLISS